MIKQKGVKYERRNGTKTTGTSCVIGSNNGDKKPARSTKTNEMIRRLRVQQELTNGAGSKLRNARNEGWCMSNVRRGRSRSGSKQGPTLPTAVMGVLPSSTQARQRGDVSDKIDGQKSERKQESATRTMCWNHPCRRLASYTPRILSKHAGTPPNQSGTIKSRRTVKQTGGATVYNCISRMKVALMIFIYSLQVVSLQSTSYLSAVYQMFICSLKGVYRQSTSCLPAVYRLSTYSL